MNNITIIIIIIISFFTTPLKAFPVHPPSIPGTKLCSSANAKLHGH
jgi:hypothetical protein